MNERPIVQPEVVADKALAVPIMELQPEVHFEGPNKIGITRRNKEESKKRRKMAKASRRINRH